MTEVGDALVDVVFDGVHERRRSRLRDILDWFASVAKPPPGVRLVSDDGGEFTGFVVVEDNRPVLMLALRVGTSPSRPAPREPTYLRHVADDDLWRHGDDPYSYR